MSQFVSMTWAPLKADANEGAVNSLKGLTPEVKAQKGLVALYHGKVDERPNSVEIVTVWQSEADYQASQKAEYHGKVATLFKELVDTSDPNVHPYHTTIVFSDSFEKVADAPVANMTALFLPSSVDKAEFEATWKSIVEGVHGSIPDGFIAGAHGWASEEIEHPKISGKTKIFVAASGWASSEKNEAAAAGLRSKFDELRKYTETYDSHHTTFEKA